MSSSVLKSELRDGVQGLTLNRPKKRNALNGDLVSALSDALARAATDDDVRVILLRGEGKDFCAGADLAELERVAGMDHGASVAHAMEIGDLFIRMRRHPKPIVAAVHGRALAGGCGLAMACDLIIAREDAELGYPEINLGFVPAMVMAILRRRVTETVAFELVATGARIRADQALELGMVNHVWPAEAFDEEVDSLLETLAGKPASALELSKGLLYEIDGMGFEEAIQRGAEVNATARETQAYREGVRRFLDRSRD
jgi:methylglutaconyl-CoA hydratase